jgi:hypothetical protein
MKGSLLLITEPEYVEWDSTEELYPFVFESIGDWEVTTSVEPPEGFEADYKALDAPVSDELEAIQFTVTDVGSSWTETKVKYKIKHKNKIKNLKSNIGIKLSKELAKQKNKGIFGDTEDPRPFKGGKKVKKEKEKRKRQKNKIDLPGLYLAQTGNCDRKYSLGIHATAENNRLPVNTSIKL